MQATMLHFSLDGSWLPTPLPNQHQSDSLKFPFTFWRQFVMALSAFWAAYRAAQIRKIRPDYNAPIFERGDISVALRA